MPKKFKGRQISKEMSKQIFHVCICILLSTPIKINKAEKMHKKVYMTVYTVFNLGFGLLDVGHWTNMQKKKEKKYGNFIFYFANCTHININND